MEVNPLIAFGAGLISIFSPCVLPLLPGHRRLINQSRQIPAFAIVLGLSISFTTMGLVASAFGAVFAAFSYYLFRSGDNLDYRNGVLDALRSPFTLQHAAIGHY